MRSLSDLDVFSILSCAYMCVLYVHGMRALCGHRLAVSFALQVGACLMRHLCALNALSVLLLRIMHACCMRAHKHVHTSVRTLILVSVTQLLFQQQKTLVLSSTPFVPLFLSSVFFSP